MNLVIVMSSISPVFSLQNFLIDATKAAQEERFPMFIKLASSMSRFLTSTGIDPHAAASASQVDGRGSTGPKRDLRTCSSEFA